MALNKSTGNMYDFCTHTWNTVKGKCPHSCEYCYMKRWGEQPPLHFDEKELKTDLGEGNFIFVGSSCDMWANEVPPRWCDITLKHCCKYENKYLFQSKSPQWMLSFLDRLQFPENSVFGTTIETNRIYRQMGNTPSPHARAKALSDILKLDTEMETMVTIEPIMDFDLEFLVHLIYRAMPKWVNIGADSQKHHLPEPSWEKVQELIAELKKFTEVKQKRNLGRLKK